MYHSCTKSIKKKREDDVEINLTYLEDNVSNADKVGNNEQVVIKKLLLYCVTWNNSARKNRNKSSYGVTKNKKEAANQQIASVDLKELEKIEL